VPMRSAVPYLILRSAGVRHSSLDASVISALLSFVLNSWVGLLVVTDDKYFGDTPINGRIRFLGDDCDRRFEPMLIKTSVMHSNLARKYATFLPQTLGCVECPRTTPNDDDTSSTNLTAGRKEHWRS
jgi:hypothetical protein